MTTIMEEPYMILKNSDDGSAPATGNDRFEGYCKDLADLIAKEARVSFEIRPVKDGKYGSPDPTAPGDYHIVKTNVTLNVGKNLVKPLKTEIPASS